MGFPDKLLGGRQTSTLNHAHDAHAGHGASPSGAAPFSCGACGGTFPSKDALEAHGKKDHPA